MSEIRRYVIVDVHNVEADFEYRYCSAAEDAARRAATEDEPLAIIARVYTYDDSELVWTSNGEFSWPPNRQPVDSSVNPVTMRGRRGVE